MSVILGLNTQHAGASAAILVDGEIKFAIAEERLNRKKYYGGFPKLAIAACLEYTNLTFEDIDYLAVGRDSKANIKKKIGYVASHPLMLKNLLKIGSARNKLDDLKTLIAEECKVDISQLNFKQIDVEHHLAHTASAYFISGWRDAAGITIDGSGDFVSILMSQCEGNQIKPLHRVYVPNSLGSFYTMVCQFIGYTSYGDEGKVMGLAPLGKDVYSDIFEDIVSFSSGNLHLNQKYFRPFGSDERVFIDEEGYMQVKPYFSDYMVKLFGPPREKGSEITQRDMDIAFGLQKRFEEVYFEILNDLFARCPNEKIVMAGGCILNSVANGKLFDHTPFKETVIQPAAGDEGLALGAALYVSRSELDESDGKEFINAYLGNEYSDDEIQTALDAENLKYVRFEKPELLAQSAQIISEGNVVGWFQGRSEWGPRALGNRSILCHPGFPGMKDILNARIKRRESFRPFAPVIMEEHLSEIFEHDYPSPFMLHVYKIREEWRERLSAVNHLDNTGRLQTTSPRHNDLYYSLIKKFKEITGIPVLLNTSFNENEPVVERPEEAIACFKRTKMDVLVIGNFICRKTDQ